MGALKIEISGNTTVVKLPKQVDSDFMTKFNMEAKNGLLDDTKLYVIDFSDCIEVKTVAFRGFVMFSQQCKKTGCVLASIGVKNDVQQKFVSEGVDKSLRPVASLVEAKAILGAPPAASPTPKIDVAIVNPFISATVKTLETQAQTKSKAGSPYLIRVEEKGYNFPIAIAGVISINSTRFNGSVTLAFPESVFLKIYENMVGEKVSQINGEIEDAAGELLNIIYGQAKTELNATQEADLRPALPTILSGEKIRIRQKTLELLMILPFETDAGKFQVEIALEKSP